MTGFLQGDRPGGETNCLTPPRVLNALGGWQSFDLDPCAAPEPRPWPTALQHLTQGGLEAPWQGAVWCNPPYDRAGLWAARMAAHGNGILLVFARTGTRWFQQRVFRAASGILFLAGRLSFLDIHGQPMRTRRGTPSNAGAPSCLVSYDRPDEPEWMLTRLELCGLPGHLWRMQ